MNKAFVSYCHSDDSFKKELEPWLKKLVKDNLIEAWDDTKIIPGDKLNQEIDIKLKDSNILISLISQEYLSSENCLKELYYSLDELNCVRLIPIILSSCTWKDTEICDRLALPKDGKPINSWNNRDEAYQNVYEGIKIAIGHMDDSFCFKPKFIMEQKKIEFSTQLKESIDLDSLWIMPTLNQRNDDINDDIISSIEDFLELPLKCYIIEGEELAGKSSLAIEILLKAEELDFKPIYIDGNNIRKSVQFDDHFQNVFENQLTGNYIKWKKQDRRIVIIDDYSHLINRNIINYLEKNFQKIIIIMNLDNYLIYHKDDGAIANYEVFSIGKLTHVKQGELIRKWLNLSLADNCSEFDTEKKIDQIEAKINSIVSKNQIVPRYPFYILSILQTLEAFMPTDYQITTYGHCYHALITAQLLKKNIASDDIESCYNFLMELSYEIYSSSMKIEKDYGIFKSNYKAKFIFSESVLNRLENDVYQLIKIKFDDISFIHKYIYYYFLGMYFATGKNKKYLNDMCSNIQIKENAFIVIFTIHHTQDKELLDDIILHSLFSFDGNTPAKLDDSETKFMNSLLNELPKNVISRKKVPQNRIDERYLRDRNNAKPNEDYDDDPDLVDTSKALRLIEVLGQIAKNRYGSYERKRISEIVDTVQDLGLRVLNRFLSSMRDPRFIEWLQNRVIDAEKERNSASGSANDFTEEEIKGITVKNVHFMAFISTIGMIGKIVEAIGSEKINEIVQELKKRIDSPAYDLIAFIILLKHSYPNAEKIKQIYNRFKKNGNQMVMRIASYAIQHYQNTHSLGMSENQKIWDAIGIDYRKK